MRSHQSKYHHHDHHNPHKKDKKTISTVWSSHNGFIWWEVKNHRTSKGNTKPCSHQMIRATFSQARIYSIKQYLSTQISWMLPFLIYSKGKQGRNITVIQTQDKLTVNRALFFWELLGTHLNYIQIQKGFTLINKHTSTFLLLTLPWLNQAKQNTWLHRNTWLVRPVTAASLQQVQPQTQPDGTSRCLQKISMVRSLHRYFFLSF